MTAWGIAAALYALGFVGLNSMSRDFSTRPRRLVTIVGLVFWPITIPLMLAGDLADIILATKNDS